MVIGFAAKIAASDRKLLLQRGAFFAASEFASDRTDGVYEMSYFPFKKGVLHTYKKGGIGGEMPVSAWAVWGRKSRQ